MNLRLPELQIHLLPIIRIASQEIRKVQVVPTQVITVFQEHSTGAVTRREDAVAMFLEAIVAAVRLFGIGRHHVGAAEVAAVLVVPELAELEDDLQQRLMRGATPIAYDSDLGDAARFEIVRENLRRYVAGEKMLSVVDVGRGY